MNSPTYEAIAATLKTLITGDVSVDDGDREKAARDTSLFYVKPEIVVEVKADEITRSPVHTAGRVLKTSKSGNALEVDVAGYALRFPRLEKFRDDKQPTDVTSLEELKELFTDQKH